MKTHTITQQDTEESALVWASIDGENATRIPVVLRVEEEPQPKFIGATNKALARGWLVTPPQETEDVQTG